MNESNTGIPFFEWLGRYISVIVPAIMAVVGGLFVLTNRYKESVAKQLSLSRDEIDGEFSKVWSEMRNNISVQTVQGSDIAVLKAEQKNTVYQLNEIKETTYATNRKIDGLTDKLTAILIEVRKER